MKGYKVIVGLIALGFAGGMFGGYRIWGPTEKGKTDIRQLLQQVNDEVARVESKNKELTESLESSREAINASEALRKENQDLKDQMKVAYQEKQELESTLEEARAKERDAANQPEDSVDDRCAELPDLRAGKRKPGAEIRYRQCQRDDTKERGAGPVTAPAFLRHEPRSRHRRNRLRGCTAGVAPPEERISRPGGGTVGG